MSPPREHRGETSHEQLRSPRPRGCSLKRRNRPSPGIVQRLSAHAANVPRGPAIASIGASRSAVCAAGAAKDARARREDRLPRRGDARQVRKETQKPGLAGPQCGRAGAPSRVSRRTGNASSEDAVFPGAVLVESQAPVAAETAGDRSRFRSPPTTSVALVGNASPPAVTREDPGASGCRRLARPRQTLRTTRPP